MIKIEFLSRLNNFLETLNNAQESLNERIILKPCDFLDLTQIENASDYMSIASNSEQLNAIEETMKIWIRQMEQVGEGENQFNLISIDEIGSSGK